MGKIRHSDGFTSYEREMMALAWACLTFWSADATRPGLVFLDGAGGRICLWTWSRLLERTGRVWPEAEK